MNNEEVIYAIYREETNSDYKDNPLIEALPRNFSLKEQIAMLGVYPNLPTEEERNDSPQERFHYIQRIFDYFQPLSSHLFLERKISTIIKQGYVNRNPLDKNNTKYMNESYQLLMEGKLPESLKRNKDKKVQGFSIIGTSSTGKTTAVERILGAYPQKITHVEYREKVLLLTQFPYLKIECSPDGSLKGLCINFFRELDNHIGMNYIQKYSSATLSIMVSEMGHLANLHNIGVLIVDEIQHLSLQKSGGADQMLNFFVALVNAVGVPVILIGTNKSFGVLNEEIRQAIRGAGQGETIWKRMENNREWQMMIKGLCKFQWTKNPISFDKELSDLLYEETQGLLGLAVKLFAVTQMEAIVSGGKEEVTSNLIKESMKNNFPSLIPMINAIRTGDKEKLKKYEDLKPNMDEVVADLNNRLEASDYIQYLEAQSASLKKDAEKRLTLLLAKNIKNSKIIQSTVKQVFSNFHPESYDFEELHSKALEIAEDKVLKRSTQKQRKPVYQAKDLRKYSEEAKNAKESVYECIKKDGLIVNLYGSVKKLEKEET